MNQIPASEKDDKSSYLAIEDSNISWHETFLVPSSFLAIYRKAKTWVCVTLSAFQWIPRLTPSKS